MLTNWGERVVAEPLLIVMAIVTAVVVACAAMAAFFGETDAAATLPRETSVVAAFSTNMTTVLPGSSPWSSATSSASPRACWAPTTRW